MNGSLRTPNCNQLQEKNSLYCRRLTLDISNEVSPVLSLKDPGLPTFACSLQFLCHPFPGADMTIWRIWRSQTLSCSRMLQPRLVPWSRLQCACINTYTVIKTWVIAKKKKKERRTRLSLPAARPASADCSWWRQQRSPALRCPCAVTGLSTAQAWTGFPRCTGETGYPTNHYCKFTKSAAIVLSPDLDYYYYVIMILKKMSYSSSGNDVFSSLIFWIPYSDVLHSLPPWFKVSWCLLSRANHFCCKWGTMEIFSLTSFRS